MRTFGKLQAEVENLEGVASLVLHRPLLGRDDLKGIQASLERYKVEVEEDSSALRSEDFWTLLNHIKELLDYTAFLEEEVRC